MTTPVLVNLILAVPFVLAIVGIPLWMTWKRADTPPDFSGAREYLAAKAARHPAPVRIPAARPRAEADLIKAETGSALSAPPPDDRVAAAGHLARVDAA